jgi:N-acyl-phosphatidylethanolamine-hydrolysing phospholipase D
MWRIPSSQQRRPFLPQHQYPQQQHQHQQRRYYYYFPTTWEELSERFVRWMERTEARLMVVHVKLVRRRQLQLQLRQSRQLQQQQPGGTTSSTTSTTTIRQVSRRQISKFMGRTHARWNSFFYQKYHGPLTSATTTTLEKPTTIPTTPFSATTVEQQLQESPKQRLATNNNNNNDLLLSPLPSPRPSLRSRYLGWKSRRREQYDRYRRSATAAMTRSSLSPSSFSSSLSSSSSNAFWKMKPVLVKEYSKPEWFDPLVGRPVTSQDSIGRYVNPWQSQSTNGLHSPLTVLQWRWERFQQHWLFRHVRGRSRRRLHSRRVGNEGGSVPSIPSSSCTATSSSTTTSTTIPTITPHSTTTTQEDEEQLRLLLSTLQQPPQRVVDPSSPLPIPRFLRQHEHEQQGPTQEQHDSTTTTTMSDTPNTTTGSNPTNSSSSSSNMALTWIGHSTCYLQMHGYSILFDPIFSHKSSPYQQDYIPIGETRIVPPSHSIAQLVDHGNRSERGDGSDDSDDTNGHSTKGMIDFCCITHDHYDHMDLDSVRELAPVVHWWVVPLDIGPWLIEKGGIDPAHIIELKWWHSARFLKKNPHDKNMGRPLRLMNRDDTTIPTPAATTAAAFMDTTATTVPKENLKDVDNQEDVFTISCCPASHWGSRTMFDRNKRLWGSFALTTPHQRFFFCGDTGLPETFPLFRQIGDAYGPFDLACIPIGAYEPAHYNKDAHINPEEAVKVHQDLMSRYSIGIHWGTFALGDEPFEEPPLRLQEAMAQAKEAAAASANAATEGGEVVTVAPFETILQGRTVIVHHRQQEQQLLPRTIEEPEEDKEMEGDMVAILNSDTFWGPNRPPNKGTSLRNKLHVNS